MSRGHGGYADLVDRDESWVLYAYCSYDVNNDDYKHCPIEHFVSISLKHPLNMKTIVFDVLIAYSTDRRDSKSSLEHEDHCQR